ncbi:hypothetical protein [Brevibacterium aurantiacum]|uniref:hypothetical protein n=1 Tax=Brevibacterium aurantiacum TaxID=273384 RepID=UPI0011AECC97|nr:hypothetical protein [Brevibacterium aurantiacum]
MAAGYALLMGLVIAFVEWALNSLGSSFATSVMLTQLVSLGLTLAGFMLLHLLGARPDWSVRPLASARFPAGY